MEFDTLFGHLHRHVKLVEHTIVQVFCFTVTFTFTHYVNRFSTWPSGMALALHAGEAEFRIPLRAPETERRRESDRETE